MKGEKVIYRVTVINNDQQLNFEFRTSKETEEFLITVMYSLVGFDEGTARILLHKIEESPTDGNQ